jgi:diphosphomevalonate decarboxylase
MWLNGEEVSISSNKRLVKCLQEIRRISNASDEERLRICSRNNFPTAAGLASSAAGYACLMFALSRLFGISDKSQLSILTRLGSGSAIRSIDGGFVQWVAGDRSDNSVAQQIVDHDYWPEMRVVLLVVNAAKKETGSTDGMRRSVQTSPLLQHRANVVVPERINSMIQAIRGRDFESFAELTMKDSNQFHAIALETYPPLRYMTDLSGEIVRLVHAVNEFYSHNRLAYTFDAGPNACIYLLQDMLPLFFALITKYFPFSAPDFVRGRPAPDPVLIPADLDAHLTAAGVISRPGSLQFVINTMIGRGAEISETESLLNEKGEPLL